MPSLYDISMPVFIRALENLDRILDKAAAWSGEQERSADDLAEARLASDMLPLAGQIQRASDTAKGVAARVGGLEPVAMADEEKTISDLKERIARTIAVLRAVPAAAFDGKADAAVELKTPSATYRFTGQSYVTEFAIPNFFFHVTTAYAVLRKEGVPIGKSDYLGAMPRQD